MLKNWLGLMAFVLYPVFIKAQSIKILNTGNPVSLRGLSVVNDRTVWVSGSAGHVGLSRDGGMSWKWMQVPGYEKSDFRDIEAFSDREAVIMGITEPAVMLRTTDGGEHWKTVLQDSAKSVFLDAVAFSGDYGAVIGDPVNGKIYFAESLDRGTTWQKNDLPRFDMTEHGESFFAASGSNIILIPSFGNAGKSVRVLVSGGKKSCLYFGTRRYPLSTNQGKETTGANSVAINPSDPNQAMIVGGDFSHDTVRYGNSIRVRFHPFVQEHPQAPPHGYRSCVEYINGKQLICCGTTGVDISGDGGRNWTLITNQGFHVCRKSKAGQSIYLAGANGIIGILEWPAHAHPR
jgi:hypothetical protein